MYNVRVWVGWWINTVVRVWVVGWFNATVNMDGVTYNLIEFLSLKFVHWY